VFCAPELADAEVATGNEFGQSGERDQRCRTGGERGEATARFGREQCNSQREKCDRSIDPKRGMRSERLKQFFQAEPPAKKRGPADREDRDRQRERLTLEPSPFWRRRWWSHLRGSPYKEAVGKPRQQVSPQC
jgi:hypothetical protein